MSETSLDIVKKMQGLIIAEMQKSHDMLTSFIENRKTKMTNITDQYHQNEQNFTNQKDQLQRDTQKSQKEITELLLEKETLESSINIKTKEISSMENLVLKKLPNEYSSFEFLYKKEVAIHQKIKIEKTNYKGEKDMLIQEINETIDLYKNVSGLKLEKTNEGLLRIDFFQGKKDSKFFLVLEVVGNLFKVVEIFPQCETKKYEVELNQDKNLTLFLAKIVVYEFQKLI